MIRFSFLFCFAFSAFFYGQDIVIGKNHLLFTFRENSYLLNDNNLYYISPQRFDFIARIDIPKIEYKFLETEFGGFLISHSGGIYFEFDGCKFLRLDKSYNFNSQYFNYSFGYEEDIYSFGGYGLFTYKNIITQFDLNLRETFLLETNTQLDKHPLSRKKMIAQFTDDKLYISNGLGIKSTDNPGSVNESNINDVWSFDINNKKWTELGKSLLDLGETPFYDVVYGNHYSWIISPVIVAKIDVSKNEVLYFDEANFELIDTFHKERARYDLTINNKDGGVYVVVNQSNNTQKIVFVSLKEFFGKVSRKNSLYSVDFRHYLFLSITVALVLSAVYISFRAKRKNRQYKSVIKNKSSIISTLNLYEQQIFLSILNAYPSSVTFPDLMTIFDSKLSYESKKKKLRTALDKINYQLKYTFPKNNIQLLEIKDDIDNRIKRVKFNFS